MCCGKHVGRDIELMYAFHTRGNMIQLCGITGRHVKRCSGVCVHVSCECDRIMAYDRIMYEIELWCA
jgi:hypothetical protein